MYNIEIKVVMGKINPSKNGISKADNSTKCIKPKPLLLIKAKIFID
jgi:hypothetical protein